MLDGVGGQRGTLGVGGVGGGRSGGHAAKRHAQRRRTERELRTLAGKGIEWEGEKGRLISLKPRCHLSPQTSAHRKLPLTPSARPAHPDPDLYTCYLPAPALPPPAQVNVPAPCVPARPAPRDLPPAYPPPRINLRPCAAHVSRQRRLISSVSVCLPTDIMQSASPRHHMRITHLARRRPLCVSVALISLLFRHRAINLNAIIEQHTHKGVREVIRRAPRGGRTTCHVLHNNILGCAPVQFPYTEAVAEQSHRS